MNRKRGSVLVLGSVVMGLLALAVLIGYSYGGLFFEHNRLQASANEIALAGARKFNEMDRIGQMNNMIARNRQLVFSGRQQLDECVSKAPGLKDLATQLLDESRDSAKTLESQRLQLAVVARKEAKDAVLNKFVQVQGSYAMFLPWMKVEAPSLSGWQCGRAAKVDSNVEALMAVDDLVDHDKAQDFIVGSGMKLYKHDIDAHLPGSDNDLHFRISSLPAPVKKTISPARIILNGNFETIAADELPSVCRVKLWLNVGTGLGPKAEGTMSCVGTASATGGMSQQ
ncbi:MAG: hypothetical protein JNN26_21020 [Candidatus Obscuribacter sp.]|nr:hypothetical protein [Candidatus Obscuribacter sp.]